MQLGVILLDDLQVGIPAGPSLVSLQRQRGVVLVLHIALEVITKRLHLADGVECLLGFLVGILDVPRQLLGCELVVDDFQRVRDYIVLLGQRSEGSEDGIVDVLQQEHLVEGVDHVGLMELGLSVIPCLHKVSRFSASIRELI